MDIKIPFLVALVLVALLLRLIWSHITSSRTKPASALRLPPGPWQLPLIGGLHHLLLSRFSDLPHRALREMSAAYGPVMMFRLGSVPTVVFSSAEGAKEVMKTHDLTFSNRHMGITLDTITGGGRAIIGSPCNARWRELRKLCTHELFSPRRVLSFRYIREEEVANLLCSISNECGGGQQPVNLTQGICRMVNNVVARTVVGDRWKNRDEYMHEQRVAMRLISGFSLADLYPSSRLVRQFSAAARDARRCKRNMDRIIQSIIQEREAMPMPTPGRDEDLLGALLRLKKDPGGLQFAVTNELVSRLVWDIFTGGSDSSSTVLVWIMSELVKNPQVMHKAQSEVREVFKGQERITEDDLVKLRYLQLVIKETLRLHTPSPLLLPRECRESCQVMGYDVPKGTKVLVNIWAIARDMKLWHDAEEFKPERFECSTIDFRGNDFEFTPFGAGRRICPAITFGLANLELSLASLLYHFDWDLPDGIKPEELDMAETSGVTLRKKSMLWLKAKPYTNFVPN